MGGKYVEFTDENFEREVIESQTPVLVDFWAEWCGPCRVIAPVVEELAGEYEGRVKIGKLDIDANPGVTAMLNVRSIPTIVFFKDGQIVDHTVGAVPKRILIEQLDALLNGATKQSFATEATEVAEDQEKI